MSEQDWIRVGLALAVALLVLPWWHRRRVAAAGRGRGVMPLLLAVAGAVALLAWLRLGGGPD